MVLRERIELSASPLPRECSPAEYALRLEVLWGLTPWGVHKISLRLKVARCLRRCCRRAWLPSKRMTLSAGAGLPSWRECWPRIPTQNCSEASPFISQSLCNLESVTKGQQAIREFADNTRDRKGLLPPLYGIFRDYAAPIVRNHPEGRELMMARWGMPSPVFVPKGNRSDPGVTNVRNVKSPNSRRRLGVESGVSSLSQASTRTKRCRTERTLPSGSPSTRRGLSGSRHCGVRRSVSRSTIRRHVPARWRS